MRSYLAASAMLGLLAVWGSENLFWSAPPVALGPGGLLVTWFAYTLCAAAALSAVLVTGVQGWRAAFLGGALLGWFVEGVVVDTMYAAFPFQVVWTPLAWHALVTGVLVVGLGRVAGGWRLSRRLAAWTALGLFAGLWAAYWPTERGEMPGLAATAGYLLGLGLLVPLAQLALDRIGTLVPPRPWVLWIAPGLIALAWLARVAAAPHPVHLVWPALLLVTVATMWRLGEPAVGLRFGSGHGLARHSAVLVAPAVTSVVAVALWAAVPAGLSVHVPVALVTCTVSLGLAFRLGWQALRSGRDRHHDPSALEGVHPGSLGEEQPAQ